MTTQHYTHWKCKEVEKSFLKARARLLEEAKTRKLETIVDNGWYFKAEGFDCCKSRVTLYAGKPGDGGRQVFYVERQYYNGDYIETFEPKQ